MFNYKITGLVAGAKMPVFQLLRLQDAYEDSRRLNPILKSGALIQTKKPPPNTEKVPLY